LVEGHGLPIGLAAAKANRHDMKLVKKTLQSSFFKPKKHSRKKKPNLCLDKGYDYSETRETVIQMGYVPHIRSRGEEQKAKKDHGPEYQPRRWVVERTHSWMNRYRRILIRWEKKTENYEAMLHLSCALICFKASGVFG